MQDQDYDECRAYVTRMLDEHRRLHQLLIDARSKIESAKKATAPQSFAVVVQVLQQVRKELQDHFSEEEEGGCLDEAVARHPGLGAEADRVEAEHPDLLLRLDRLIEMASVPEKMRKDQLTFDSELADLYQRLHAHEATENRLLQQGFSVPTNGEEADET